MSFILLCFKKIIKKIKLFGNVITADCYFLLLPIKKKTVLLLEANECHTEVLPGYAKYLIDLNYNVDVVMVANDGKKAFCRFKNKRLKIYRLTSTMIGMLLKEKKRMKYKRIIISSYHIYRSINEVVVPVPFEKYFNGFNIFKDSPICVVHNANFERTEYTRTNNVLTLVKMTGQNINSKIVNPHYYGNIVIKRKLNKIRRFVVVGNIEKERKNIDLLIRSCKYLIQCGVINFEIDVIGAGSKNIDTCNNYIRPLGYLSFDKLYIQLEKADFLIALLDPENSRHIEYNNKASGTYQLSYGFLKPVIINKIFTENQGYTKDSSIIYSSNSDLQVAMKAAIEMKQQDYLKMQDELQLLSSTIYKKSISNLKDFIDKR